MSTLNQIDQHQLEMLAVTLAARLPKRVVIGLSGTLGAGKTRFVQAFAGACGVETSLVTSPTFTIVQTYFGDRKIHHIDAYRLADEDEFIELGGEELLEEDATVLIEWPGRIDRCMPSDIIAINLQIETPPDFRKVTAFCRDESLLAIVASAFQASSEASSD